jgi:3-hydroxyisobutyrate dehydrogenase-like beta-hydroxyacid dehydrogenase
MSETNQIKLGLVGFGEVGSTLGRGFRGQGLKHVMSYDKYAFDGPYSALIQKRAADAGVPLARSPEELAQHCDVIIGVTPGVNSIESAEAFAPHLKAHHVFVDFASATPKVKQAVGKALTPSGASIADASIMGTPHVDGHRLPILVSGPASERFLEMLTPWGLKIEHVTGDLGAASGIKIMRSVVAKGLEALLVECVLGARRYGIDNAVLTSFGKFADSRPFTEFANFLMVTDVIHADRRGHEARMSADALEDAGIEPIMTRATAERLEWVAALGAKEHFGGEVPKDYTTAMEGLEALMAGAKQK